MAQDMIGNAAAVELLTRAIKEDAVAHGYLIAGPRSVGKTRLVDWFVRELVRGEPATHPDVTSVRRADEKSEIAVAQIRALRERLAMSSLLGGWKVAIIENAEELSLEAANALLKTLEEPTPRTVIFLIAKDASALPATVRSRVQTIHCRMVSSVAIAKALEARGAKRAEAAELARIAAGRPGVAITLFEDKDARAAHEAATKTVAELIAAKLPERIRAAEKLVTELPGFFDRLEIALRDELVAATNILHTLHALSILTETRRGYDANVNPRLAMERLMIYL